VGSIGVLSVAELVFELQGGQIAEGVGVLGSLCYGLDWKGRGYDADQAAGRERVSSQLDVMVTVLIGKLVPSLKVFVSLDTRSSH